MDVIRAIHNGAAVELTVDDLPDVCPQCHHAIHAITRWATVYWCTVGTYTIALEAVFQCPRRECQHLSIATYRGTTPTWQPVNAPGNTFRLLHVVPEKVMPITFPQEIGTLSPLFVSIYNQANAAQTYALPDVAGPGYRKALEFLVKDYLIKKVPDDMVAIKKELLSTVISIRVEDANIKKVAQRAAWLGNDETHYERRWVNKDITDLKQLIQLVVNWIHNDLMTEAALMDMPKAK